MNHVLLADVTFSEAQLAWSIIGILGAVLSTYFLVQRFVRDQSGVKETTQMVLTHQPLRTQAETRMATHEEVLEVKKDVDKLREEVGNKVNDLHRQITGQFKSLNEDRRETLGELNRKIDRHGEEQAKLALMIMEKIGQLHGRKSA